MFIDESVDKPFRENFPEAYERLFKFTINEDGNSTLIEMLEKFV